MAAGLRIWRFDGPPPCSPDDPRMDQSPLIAALAGPCPAIPFGPQADLRAVFDRHLPGLRWNDSGDAGFYRRDRFRIQLRLPGPDSRAISLAIDEWGATERLLRAIEAENPDWYCTWYGGTWLRDAPAPRG
ncbi:hypothetical protein [Mameliella sp.]|uniref:hypothetical protein n=1 Tax=Mameliella sp. TaxID=1924940 RepID=UPI003B503AF7